MIQMQINGSETDVLRLFHLDLPREAIERFVTQAGTGEWPLKYGLGAKVLRPSFVDVVDLRELGDMRLSDYMVEAHGAAGADFKAGRMQIDALRGHVLILPSQVFNNTSQDLTVAPPLRWIGTFSEVKPKARGAKVQSASAKGQASGVGIAGKSAGSSMILRIVVIGIVVLALMVAALILR